MTSKSLGDYPFPFEVVLCLSIIYLPPPEKDYKKLRRQNASIIFAF